MSNEEIKRFDFEVTEAYDTGPCVEEQVSADGEYVRYSDHAAAIRALASQPALATTRPSAALTDDLPPLPDAIEVGGEGWDFEDFKSWKTFSVEHMDDYARKAVAEDRKRRDVTSLQHRIVLKRAIDCLEILDKRPRPMCRDCADEDGTCPNGGLECDMRKLIADSRAILAASSGAVAVPEGVLPQAEDLGLEHRSTRPFPSILTHGSTGYDDAAYRGYTLAPLWSNPSEGEKRMWELGFGCRGQYGKIVWPAAPATPAQGQTK